MVRIDQLYNGRGPNWPHAEVRIDQGPNRTIAVVRIDQGPNRTTFRIDQSKGPNWPGTESCYRNVFAHTSFRLPLYTKTWAYKKGTTARSPLCTVNWALKGPLCISMLLSFSAYMSLTDRTHIRLITVFLIYFRSSQQLVSRLFFFLGNTVYRFTDSVLRKSRELSWNDTSNHSYISWYTSV